MEDISLFTDYKTMTFSFRLNESIEFSRNLEYQVLHQTSPELLRKFDLIQALPKPPEDDPNGKQELTIIMKYQTQIAYRWRCLIAKPIGLVAFWRYCLQSSPLGTLLLEFTLRYPLSHQNVWRLEVRRQKAVKGTGVVGREVNLAEFEPLSFRHQYGSEKEAEVYVKLPFLYEESCQLNLQPSTFNRSHKYKCVLARDLVEKADHDQYVIFVEIEHHCQEETDDLLSTGAVVKITWTKAVSISDRAPSHRWSGTVMSSSNVLKQGWNVAILARRPLDSPTVAELEPKNLKPFLRLNHQPTPTGKLLGAVGKVLYSCVSTNVGMDNWTKTLLMERYSHYHRRVVPVGEDISLRQIILQKMNVEQLQSLLASLGFKSRSIYKYNTPLHYSAHSQSNN